MRLIARTDSNQRDIVRAIRSCGGSWMDCHQLGEGKPDGIAGWFGRFNDLIEVKMPGEKLTEDEGEFHKNWKGQPVEIVYSVEDVARLRDRHVVQMHREDGEC